MLFQQTVSSSSSPPLVHFCTYKDKFISLYCRLSSVLDLDALITQQALREAITDSEVATAKQRHQLILDYIQVRNTNTHTHTGGGPGSSSREDGGLSSSDVSVKQVQTFRSGSRSKKYALIL